jgi:hypothetical protein
MAYKGFVGSGTIGHFQSTTALQNLYPADMYAGRMATVEVVAGSAAHYYSNGISWQPNAMLATDSTGKTVGIAGGNSIFTTTAIDNPGSSLSLLGTDAADTPAIAVAASSGYGPTFVDHTDARLNYWGNLRWNTSAVGIIGDSSTATTKYYTPMFFSIGVVSKLAKFRCQFPTSNRLGYRVWVNGKSVRSLPRGGTLSITTVSGSQNITAGAGVLNQYLGGSVVTASGVPSGAVISKINSAGTAAVLSVAATASATVSATFASTDGLGYVSAAGMTDLTLTFPGYAPRDIVFSLDGGIHTVTGDSNATFYKANVKRGRRALVMADSWGEASLGGVMQAVHLLGYTDIHLSANGGTGYIATNVGAGGKNYATRITEYLSAGIDDFFLFGSLNDSEAGYTGAQVASVATAVWDQIGATGARLYVSGVQFANQHSTFNRDETNAAFVAAAASRPFVKAMVAPKDWITGYGWVDSPDGGMCDYYTSDSVGNHLTVPEGNGYFAKRFVAASGA